MTKFKVVKLIDIIRRRFPDTEWKYSPITRCYHGKDGSYIRLVTHSFHDNEESDLVPSSWCRYFKTNRTPEWV